MSKELFIHLEFANHLSLGKLLKDGATNFTTYNHMTMPVGYTTPEQEYNSLINDVTLWDVAGERQVEVVGEDAAKFVQYLTPRNLSTFKG